MQDEARAAAAADEGVTTDGRLLRGQRSRQAIARRAADLASREGLAGLSLGALAADLQVSKSGVQTLFGTKEKLQLAAAESARESFHEAVVRPASHSERGLPRLRALLDAWLDYAQAPLFTGGCFWSATLPEFDSKPGTVRDALRAQHNSWLELLADEVREAAGRGHISDCDCDLTAFELDAVLNAVNIALRLDDRHAVGHARHIIATILAPRREQK